MKLTNSTIQQLKSAVGHFRPFVHQIRGIFEAEWLFAEEQDVVQRILVGKTDSLFVDMLFELDETVDPFGLDEAVTTSQYHADNLDERAQVLKSRLIDVPLTSYLHL